jgi:hypothetical protein
MRRRLYYLLPSVQQAKSTLDDLLLARVEERHIHVLAKDGTKLGDLPPATIEQRSDLIHAMEMGLFTGALTGLVAGGFAFLFPPDGLQIGVTGVALLFLLGAIFGVWASGLVGSDVPNTRLRRFEGAIKRGQVLMMVDVPKERVPEVEAIMKKRHPKASASGSDPMIPAFP